VFEDRIDAEKAWADADGICGMRVTGRFFDLNGFKLNEGLPPVFGCAHPYAGNRTPISAHKDTETASFEQQNMVVGFL
jgi:hypothetical protein